MLLKYFGARDGSMGRVGRDTDRADAIIFRKSGWAGSHLFLDVPYFSPTPIFLLFLNDGAHKKGISS